MCPIVTKMEVQLDIGKEATRHEVLIYKLLTKSKIYFTYAIDFIKEHYIVAVAGQKLFQIERCVKGA
ncbi:hypothetical protein LQZ18_09410 [Lachnospiraceae bacterium ZAX-1]